jgi:TetR/AcrR family transcriptional regulator, transcriptional repressor for nem operon
MNYKHDKEAVIVKGMNLFWVYGYHNMGIDKICSETGMTKGAFYNTFKSKENFLLTIIEAYGDFISAHLQKTLSDDRKPAITRLRNLYKEMLKVQPESEYRGCLVNNMMSELGALNSSVAELVSTQFEKFIQVIEPTVAEAQKAGDLDKSLDSKLMAELIHTSFFGMLTRAKSTRHLQIDFITEFLKLLKPKKNGRK